MLNFQLILRHNRMLITLILNKLAFCSYLLPYSCGAYSFSYFEGIPASHIFLSQRPDKKEKQVINLDQDVQVCGYFWWMVCELLCMHHFSLFLSFWIRGYLFFLLFFDMLKHVAYLLWVYIFYLLFFFA